MPRSAAERAADAINVLDFKADPTGATDSGDALNAAFASAASRKVGAYIPCGIYKHAGLITITGVPVHGDGACSILESTATTGTAPDSAIKLTGTAPRLSGVKVVSDWTGARSGNDLSSGIYVTEATGFSVSWTEVAGSPSVGIFVHASHGGSVENNYVHDTLADGITVAKGVSSDVRIATNRVDNAGDDELSVVSYSPTDSAQNSGISIIGNSATNGKARGINIAGGRDIIVSLNYIYNPAAQSAITIIADQGFSTYGNDHVVVTSNVADKALWCFTAAGVKDFPVNDVQFSGNSCTNMSLNGATVGGAETGASGLYTSDVVLAHNRFVGTGNTAGNYGLYLAGKNITVDDNYVSGFALAGISASSNGDNSGYLKVTNNHVDSVSLASPGTYSAYALYNAGFASTLFTGNTQTNGSGTVGGLASFGASDLNIVVDNNHGEVSGMPVPTAPQTFIAHRRSEGTQAPTSGAWSQGDYVLNTLSSVGQPIGWINVASGTPGTWVPMATLAPADKTSIGVGDSTLYSLAAGASHYNAALGYSNAQDCTDCAYQVSLGAFSLLNNQHGGQNVAVGANTLVNYQGGAGEAGNNTAVGHSAMTGSSTYDVFGNTVVGALAMPLVSTGGNYNTMLGDGVAAQCTTCASNLVLGYQVGSTTLKWGSGNILIGTSASVDVPAATTSNYLNIGGVITGSVDPAHPSVSIPSLYVTASGSTTARTLADRAADVVNVRDFGAKCDDSTDDTASINAALDYARTRMSSGVLGTRIVFPSGGICLHSGTLNFTGIMAPGSVVEGGGATLDCEVSGAACVDAFQTRWLHWRDLFIRAKGTAVPTIGLQIGIIGSGVADANSFDNVSVNGNFSLAAVYNRNSETTLWNHLIAWNSYSGGTAYDLVLDGYNHFGVTSAFQTVTLATDTANSFQENTFLAPDLRRTGPGAAVWSGSTMRHRYVGGYVGNTGASGVTNYGFVLYGSNALLDADVHFEAYPYITDAIYVTAPSGTTSETLNGLRVRDNLFEGTNSVFKVDSGLSGGVTLTNADIEIGGLMYATKVFDSTTPWTAVSGSYKLPAASTAWNLPAAQFSGIGMVGASPSFSGNGAALTNVPFVLPSTLSLSNIFSTGGVSSITVTAHANYEFASGSTFANFPQPTIAAPSSGQQALAHTATMYYRGAIATYMSGSNYVPATAGAGCSVNDILRLSGGTYTSQVAFQVKTVDANGGVLTMGNNGQGSYTALPAEGVTLTGGTCTTAPTLAGMLWGVQTVSVDTAGSGYQTSPTVTFPSGYNGTTTATATLNSTMTLQAGSAAVVLSSSGTQLGVAGTAGSPVLTAGALIDNSGVRTALTTSGYTVPANTSLVRFTQTATIASATITLPTALADGQAIQFVNYAGAVTALTFSPAVSGWTNASTLAANTGLRVRWDATAAAWYREQ